MKKLICLLIAAAGSASAIAQGPSRINYAADSLLSRWVVDVNLMGGLASQEFTTVNSAPNYTNGVNMNAGELTYKNAFSFGAQAQLGFFFGKKRHFGLGTGILLMKQHGDAELNSYHVEYQATDGAGNIYRQVVTGNDLRETISSTNINIPVVLKYKNRFSKHWGFAAEAGAVINLKMTNEYTTHASFDYEAIYKFQTAADGGTRSVYDNAPTPSVNDWLITKAEFLRNNPNGNVEDYFKKKRDLGINVGDGMNPQTTTGKTSYTQGSIGFIIQPSFNYFLSDNVALNFGAYYMFQPFKNSAQNNYRLTDGMGTYSSVLNGATASTNQNYGLNIGARFFLGRKDAPISISSMAHSSPSQCGLCDGSITLDGLTPNKPVTVDYSVNGTQPAKYATNVQPDGKVKIANLCSGNYTGIVARIKGKNAMGQAVTLTDPKVNIASQSTSNPSATGSCNGSVTLYGKYAGVPVAISYNRDGVAQTAFNGIGNSDNSITVNGLCEGKYTGLVASVNNCTTKGADFTLLAPTPPPPPPVAPVVVNERIDISTPILFDVNKTTVHEASYSEIDEAAIEMKENKGSSITIDGHADASGDEAKNRVLALARANSVKSELVKRGVSAKRLKTRGHGSSVPAATNATYDGKKQNRRAIMTMTPPAQK